MFSCFQYKLKIVSCDDTKIKLNINAANFDLGFGLNTFSVGDGINFGDNQILPELKSDYDGNSLPDNKPIQEYASTGNELWIIANLPDGNCKFVVNYVVIVPGKLLFKNLILTETDDKICLARDVIYLNETKGFFYSPDFNGTNYPSELEQQYLIDVSGESGDYVDLLFTVEEFDLNGARGDYVKLSQGDLHL